MKKNTLKSTILIITLLLFSSYTTIIFADESEADTVDQLKPYSDIYDHMLTHSLELEFFLSYRHKTEDGKLEDFKASSLTCNGQTIIAYGKNYNVTLQEGENTIISTYKDGNDILRNTFTIICDTKKPIVQVEGIHHYMMVDQEDLYFSVHPKDNYSKDEAIKVSVFFKKKIIKEEDGKYHIKAKKKDWNTLSIVVEDEAGNTNNETYQLVYYPIDTSASELIDTLIDYVPAMGINIEQSEGVTVGKSTEIGTFGGYVILKTDKTIKNVDGFDLAVKGSWSSDNVPLYSVAVMRDSNNNGLADDDNWYYLSDEGSKPHSGATSYITYIRDDQADNIGYANIDGGKDYRVESSSDGESIFATNFEYSNMTFDDSMTLEGILKNESESVNTSTASLENKYEFETAITADGKAAHVSGVDFIKIYSNAFLISSDGIPISTRVYSARFLSPTELDSHGNANYDHSNFPFYFSEEDLIDGKLKALSRMEALYHYNQLILNASEETQLLDIFKKKNTLVINKLVRDIDEWTYDLNTLLEIKYQFDELSVNVAKTLPEASLIKLDSAILSALDLSVDDCIDNQTDSEIQYVYGLGLSLAMQDIDRYVMPKIVITKDSTQNHLMTLYKDGRKQDVIIMPLKITFLN